MEKEDYFGELTQEENNLKNEFADDIVFARFINYMQTALLHRKINYDRHQEFLKRKEENLDAEGWSVLSDREDSSVHSLFCINADCNKLSIAINKLTEKQRIVIVNHYYKNQSLDEIAKELNMKSNAVYQLKVRAILSLKRFMED